MAMSQKLGDLLQARHVGFRQIRHDEAATSQEVASAAHVPGWKLAKVVALRDDRGRWILGVVPAPCRIDLRALSAVSGHHELRLASEREIARRFPDAEPGAMPPFEDLYRVPVFIDLSFSDAKDIYFEDGTHHGLVRMRLQDYIRVAEPSIGRFAVGRSIGH